MSVEPFRRAPFEVVEAEFFFELLMRLFADPVRLDGAGQLLDRRVGGQVREVILALAGRAMLAHEPDFLAWQVLSAHIEDPLRRPVCDTHANSGEACREYAFGAAPPTDLTPWCSLKHHLRRTRGYVGYRILSRAPAIGDGKYHADIGGVNLLFERDANSPGEAALAQTCRKCAERPYLASARTQPKRTARANPVDLSERDLGLGPIRPQLLWNPGAIQADRIARPTLRQEQAQAHAYHASKG
jgi:hypothetical protein